jgi:hypothetical protein
MKETTTGGWIVIGLLVVAIAYFFFIMPSDAQTGPDRDCSKQPYSAQC